MPIVIVRWIDKRLQVKNPGGPARISWISAKDLWRIDEGRIIVPADRIRTHTQTEHVYNIYFI